MRFQRDLVGGAAVPWSKVQTEASAFPLANVQGQWEVYHVMCGEREGSGRCTIYYSKPCSIVDFTPTETIMDEREKSSTNSAELEMGV